VRIGLWGMAAVRGAHPTNSRCFVDKRYQVFVSSTYKDLIEERQEVMQALLETDCIPVGMELFPASSESQWDYIKRVIDECDYYILILAGRYGSLSPDGMSYTEKEYRYALENGKPTVAFYHENPSQIVSAKSESEDKGKEKLKAFRDFVLDNKMCKPYSNAYQLGAFVSRSITQIKKSHPAVGWVRADSVISGDSAEEILKLKKDIEALEEKLKENDKFESFNIDVNKTIEFEISIDFISGYAEDAVVSSNEIIKKSFNFNKILDELIPYLVEPLFKREIDDFINRYVEKDEVIHNVVSESIYETFSCYLMENSLRKFISVLLALDIIVISSDKYWLSAYGEKLLASKVRNVFLKGEINA
jgi:Domain of unknown function (DUF4062)